MSLDERVRETVATALNLPTAQVTDMTAADNTAAWDSLAHVNLMMAVEQVFDIELEVEDFPRLTSVATIRAHLERLGLG